uniref:O-antigen ligase family protein n=1 Tax=Cellulophaga sp. Z1A5H TaxID=2687291 RepID=UPI0013FD601B
FWVYYFVKVLYTENLILDHRELGRNWFEYIFYAITFVIFPFLTFIILPIEKYRNYIINGIIFSGFILGIVGLYLYGHLLQSGIGRINQITYQTGEAVLNPLNLSYSGSLTIVLCLYRLIIQKKHTKKVKLYLIITIILSFAMFLLGSSRGSVVSLFLTFPLFLMYSPMKKKISLIIISLLSIPVIYWAINASGSSIVDRILSTKEDKGGGRDSLWTDALNHFIENPIFGGKIEVSGIYPHNFIIETLMSTGIVGAFLLFPIIILGFKLCYEKAKDNKLNLFILIILIQGFTQHFFTGGMYTATLMFMPLGMAYSSIKNKEA